VTRELCAAPGFQPPLVFCKHVHALRVPPRTPGLTVALESPPPVALRARQQEGGWGAAASGRLPCSPADAGPVHTSGTAAQHQRGPAGRYRNAESGNFFSGVCNARSPSQWNI